MSDPQDHEFQCLVLAALLHDIGKFAQRAGVVPSGYEHFTEDDYGAHGAHGKWGAWFVEQFLPVAYRAAGAAVLSHHRPSDPISELVARADHLSAGERDLDAGGDPSKSRLVPILGRVYRAAWAERGFRLKPLSVRKDDIFPLCPQSSPNLTQEYASLWAQFVSDVTALRDKNPPFRAFLTTMNHLLHKYTWCVPCTVGGSEPDISLYDHLKSSAAIAAALYRSSKPGGFRLIGGDISGIQNFIYRLASPDEAQSGMAQRLRGRSFYVTLLADTIALSLLDELGLPETNILWCGGGNLTILAHDGADMSRFAAKIDRWLLDHFQGEVGLELAHVDIDEQGLMNLGDSLSRLGFELQKARLHKFPSTEWHQPFELSGGVCRVCGNDSTSSICTECALHERVGQAIPHSGYLYRTPTAGANTMASVIEFHELGVTWGLVSDLRDIPAGASAVYALNSTDMPIASVPPYVACGFRFLAQRVPGDDRGIQTFSEMERQSTGAKYLGALRMDVDNLGKVFLFGLGGNRTMSRIAALSRSIDLFFSGYLNELASEQRTAYILYAGGDDVFVVATWNDAVAMARRVRDELAEYSCENPHITISAGTHLFKHAFPIGVAAGLSKEKLEGLAKGNRSNGREKDSLAAFEFPCFWDEANAALDFAAMLAEHVEAKRLSRRFVYNILDIYRTNFRDGKESVRWIPEFHYLLKRNVSTDESSKLYGDLLAKMPAIMKVAPVWTNWVLLATRQ